MMGVEDGKIASSGSGLSPVYPEPNLAVVSIGFLLENKESAVIWRGVRKSGLFWLREDLKRNYVLGLIQEFMTNVDWGELDFLIVDGKKHVSPEFF